ncbi:MAG: methylated-DNA--[protein]-cysteine S-methyltransferase [Actinobacteria bacterium]|nr:methylated-DNA--[protein]-cysteine S-methyltransferase [Actinomycetota bacterium]
MNELASLRRSDVRAASRRAAGELAARAAARGLVDVAYASVSSPIGDLLVASTPRGLVRVAFDTEDPAWVLDELAHDVSPRVLEVPSRLDAIRRELEEYFEGRRRRFDVRVDLRLVHGFSRKVLQATARIPFGAVSTYADVAARAGSPRGARAAGNALHGNPVPIVVPCHRVIRSGGDLGGYGGREDRKEFLLVLEGALEAPGPR